MATPNLFARDPLGSLRLASNYAERALLGALSPGFGAIFLALGYAALQAGPPYQGLWVIGVLSLALAAAHFLLPRRLTGDIWLTPLSLTILFIAAGRTFDIAGVPIAAVLTALFAAAYGALVWLRKVAAADVLIFLAVGPVFMTTPELLAKAHAQGWLWYEIAIAAVMTFVGGPVVLRRGFLSALIVLSAFFYYSIWAPFVHTLGLGPQSGQALAAAAAMEASESYYTYLLSMGAPAALLAAVWTPFLAVLLFTHWRARFRAVGIARAFLDQNIVSAALGVVVLYGAFAIAPTAPMRYLFDLNALLFCGWLALLIQQNRSRWAPYGALIWLVLLQRTASHLSLIDIGLAIALYAAAIIALGGGLLTSRLSGFVPSDAARKFIALLITVNVVASILFVNGQIERQIAAEHLREPEFKIYAPLYLLILAAVLAGVSAVLLRSREPPPASIWRSQIISPRATVLLRRFFSGFWGRERKLQDFPFFSQGEAFLRHLRGDDRADMVSIVVFVALLFYMGWATIFGPLAPFISVVDPTPGQSGGARVVQFGLLAYLIGRVTRFRLYAYVGVFAILWSGIAALDIGAWSSFAGSAPGRSAGFGEIAGAGATTALFLHRLAEFLGPHVIVPGAGLIACEVIRSLVDPLRERVAARLAQTIPDDASPAPRPRWLTPAAAGAAVLVAVMVVISAFGGGGAAIVDQMAKRTVEAPASPAAAVLRLAALAPVEVAGGRLTMQNINLLEWRREAAPSTPGAIDAPVSIPSGQPPIVDLSNENIPAARAEARLELPDGAVRPVAFQLYYAGEGVRVVISLGPIERPADMADPFAALQRARRERPRSGDDDSLYAALRLYIETALAGATAPVDLEGMSMASRQRQPFIFAEAPAADAAAIEAALAAAAAAADAAGLVRDGPAIIVRPSSSAEIVLAGYAYVDLGQPLDPAA
ncbi:MAG: hypothetical protein HXY28_00825, partial [Hydrogenophilaceae bacterium]|nr:hypothetical protein [Hydrogenophilaceae bacterium]